jgi:hypothetical protein
MTSLRSWFVSAAVLLVAAFASPAAAQTSSQASQSSSQSTGMISGKLTAFFNFGFQAGSGDIAQKLSPIVYDEAANIDVAQTYEAGPLVDVGGEYMLFGKWGVGVAYNHTSGDGNATIAAQIPDPLVTDQPRAVSLSAPGLKHTENAVHVDVLYRFAATPKIDVTVGAGPTFFGMKQEFVTDVTVAETVTSPPFVNPTVTPVVSGVRRSPVGFNLSADTTYLVTPKFGVGLLLRFAHANPSIDVPNTATPVDVRAGGFQVAGGVRYRF